MLAGQRIHPTTASQSGFAGVDVAEVVLVGQQHELALVPRRARRALELLAHRGRDDVVLAAVRQQQRHADRQPRGGRRGGVAVGLLLRRAAEQPPHHALGELPLPRALEVEHARLRDDAGDRHPRPRPRRGERGEVAAGGVADRHDPVEVERREHVAQVVDAGRHVLERVRPAAAAEAPEPPVLEVPRRPAALGQVAAETVHELARVLRAPEAAVDDDGDGVRAVTAGEVQLAELRALVAVAVVLADQAATPSERAASARRVTPSSICSGVTPE